ncbi:hypothetical protein I6M59_03870 [Shewanella algae]|uniref:DUF5666 domain-containing protein n=1 Tax=Shewanella algae TaxID=38313 RepID=UPI001AAF83F1|nr:DUF5666 domain-containing protein [Shewanella algae]MBO2690887.1 hypothetical protein [Shewanella algae]
MQRSIWLVPLVAGLSACGGSDSNEPNNPDPQPPVSTLAKTIQGTLQKVDTDKLWVNGVEIPAARASVEINETKASVAELKPGMQLNIKTDGSSATSVDYDPVLVSPVSAIDGEQAVVAGYRVTGLDISKIKAGDIVEISGYNLSDNQFKATYFAIDNDRQEMEVEGRVSKLDTHLKQFYIGSMQVDYGANAVQVEGTLANGSWVEVEGQYQGEVLLASEVEVERAPDLDNGTEVELEGQVTWVNELQTRFTLNQKWQVTLDGKTLFEDGTVADLKPGALVDVEGLWQDDTQELKATEIEFEKQSQPPVIAGHGFEVEGKAVYEAGVFSINGIVLTLTPQTRFEDGLNQASLNGTWVQVEGSEQNGQFLVMEIEPEVQEADIELKGLVNNDGQGASLWGYKASDDSLKPHIGKRVDLECRFSGELLSQCRLDD